MGHNSEPLVIAERYEVGALLAKGGMGSVYYGRDQATGETVAIKHLAWEQIIDDPISLKRFGREAETLAQLTHPNIVRLLAATPHDGHHYLVMELIEGGTLRDRLARHQPLEIDHILDIALKIADALDFAHRLQIIHRDLKPANILLTPDGIPRLADFGCALLLNTVQTFTSTGSVVGTITYLSPEACRGMRLDARADLWAFGVTLYEMLTGECPFLGPNAAVVLHSIMNEPAPDLRIRRPDTPDKLIEIVRRLLIKDRDQRLSSAAQLVEMLNAVRRADEVSFELYNHIAIAPRKVKSQLPSLTSSFVGRESEIEEFATLLRNPSCRLLTLVGPGGMGKTRLSIEVAHYLLDDFADGAYFVTLTSLDAPHQIPFAIAEALQITFPKADEEPIDPATQLVNYLKEKSVLLVLDNFEHLLLVDGVEIVSKFLAGAPAVKILASSREVLNIEGEWVRPITGLDFPAEVNRLVADPTEFSAIRLFTERALPIQRDFDLTNQLTSVIRICSLVEGMPLAIEVAAAWLRSMSCAEIAAEIATSLDFLTNTRRDASDRHKSLRAVFESSWRLLATDQQTALAQLAIFSGGFLRDAAAALGIKLPTLARLVDKSLVALRQSGRYSLHELIRQYAQEKLRADAALYHHAHTQHSQHYLNWLARLGPDLQCHLQIAAAQAIDAELDNIRMAWHWAIETQAWADLQQATLPLFTYSYFMGRAREEIMGLYKEASLQSAPNILRAWLLLLAALLDDVLPYTTVDESTIAHQAVELVVGMPMNYATAVVYYHAIWLYPNVIPSHAERERVMNECLFHFADAGDTLLQANVFLDLGRYVAFFRDMKAGLALAEQSLVILQAQDEIATRAMFHYNVAYFPTVEKAQRLDHLQTSLGLWNQLGNLDEVAIVLNLLGYFYIEDHQFQAAADVFQRALAIGHELGSAKLVSMMLNGLGDLYFAQGDMAGARHHHLERLAFAKKHNHRGPIAYAYKQLAWLEQAEGNLAEAEHYYQQAITHNAASNFREGKVMDQCALILMLLEQGPPQQARAEQEWAVARQDFAQLWRPREKLLLLLTQAHRLAVLGQPEKAIELCGLIVHSPFNAAQLFKVSPTAKERAELLLQRLQVELPPEVVDAAFARGATLNLDEAIESLMS